MKWEYREFKYRSWDKFLDVIDKAISAAQNSGIPTSLHFSRVEKSSPMPNGSFREIGDIKLSRYACYLIVLNGDPNKEIIALGQTYFAVQTRKLELSESEKFEELSDDERRLQLRIGVKGFNKKLAEAASDAGVRNYSKFQNSGYQVAHSGKILANIVDKMLYFEYHSRNGTRRASVTLG